MSSDEGEFDSLGWHVIAGTELLELLRRCERGEKADHVYAELWANAEHEQVDPSADGAES